MADTAAAVSWGRLLQVKSARGFDCLHHREVDMGYPRRLLVDRESSGFYHCISRCVRRAFLCGDQWGHRRAWVENRLQELVEIFAIRSCAYTIMSNHLHLVLYGTWSGIPLGRAWFACPGDIPGPAPQLTARERIRLGCWT